MSELKAKDREDLKEKQFAFPKERKEPLEDASHVRNAIARFDQVKGKSSIQVLRLGISVPFPQRRLQPTEASSDSFPRCDFWLRGDN